jgi:hypothetical protein
VKAGDDMKHIPILFNGEMVRAILAGQKTQTRRVLKLKQSDLDAEGSFLHAGQVDILMKLARAGEVYFREQAGTWFALSGWNQLAHFQAPYGNIGDRLWVRETWAQPAALDPGPTVYRADYPACVPPEYRNVPPAYAITWKPSIHMPRSVSRITLEITDVRIEQLHDISITDCIAEGVTVLNHHMSGYCAGAAMPPEMRAFADLWDSTGGCWNSNPLVLVNTFKRVES